MTDPKVIAEILKDVLKDSFEEERVQQNIDLLKLLKPMAASIDDLKSQLSILKERFDKLPANDPCDEEHMEEIST